MFVGVIFLLQYCFCTFKRKKQEHCKNYISLKKHYEPGILCSYGKITINRLTNNQFTKYFTLLF